MGEEDDGDGVGEGEIDSDMSEIDMINNQDNVFQ